MINETILHPIGPGGGVAPAGTEPAATPPSGSPSFQRLLESLQKLAAAHRELPEVSDSEQLQAAIQHADDGFVTAMDLRRQLEEAFRAQGP